MDAQIDRRSHDERFVFIIGGQVLLNNIAQSQGSMEVTS